MTGRTYQLLRKNVVEVFIFYFKVLSWQLLTKPITYSNKNGQCSHWDPTLVPVKAVCQIYQPANMLCIYKHQYEDGNFPQYWHLLTSAKAKEICESTLFKQ
jgi:hypothetical protein